MAKYQFPNGTVLEEILGQGLKQSYWTILQNSVPIYDTELLYKCDNMTDISSILSKWQKFNKRYQLSSAISLY